MSGFRSLVLVALLASVGAGAQGLQLSAAQLAEAQAACEQLGSMPNAPLSVDACKSMLGLAAGLDAAASDPSARRPGDEAMSCAAIFAELQAQAGAGITDATRARAEAAVADGTALARRQSGEFAAFMVETYAAGVAIGVAGAFTPNFVGAALAAAWQVRAIGFATQQAAAQAPVRAQVNDALLAGIGELGQSMQANPRFARLAQLGMNKDCRPPGDPAK